MAYSLCAVSSMPNFAENVIAFMRETCHEPFSWRLRYTHAMKSSSIRINWRSTGSLLALFMLIVFLWDTWAVYPLKLLVVFFHELSHAMAAWATGGQVLGIRLDAAQGGLCITEGGIPWLVASAGYLGSMAWGAFLLMLPSKGRVARNTVIALGVLVMAASLWLIRPFLGFGFLFSLISGIALIWSGRQFPAWANAWLLNIIGLTSCLYAVLDIKSDILERPGAMSDAAILSQLTGVPTIIWGIIWFLAALAGAFYALAHACGKNTVR